MSNLDYTQISQPHQGQQMTSSDTLKSYVTSINQEIICNPLVDFSVLKDAYLFCLYSKVLICTVQLW